MTDRVRRRYRVRLIRNNNFQRHNPAVAHARLSSSPTVIIIFLRRAVAENGRITRAAVSRAVAGVTYLKSVSLENVPPGVKLVSQRLMRERVSPGPLSSAGLSRKPFVPTGNGSPVTGDGESINWYARKSCALYMRGGKISFPTGSRQQPAMFSSNSSSGIPIA